MKQYTIAARLLACILPLATIVMHGCSKVDAHADYIESQPFLSKTAQMAGTYNMLQYDYRTKYLTGDTAMLVGKLFPEDPETYIQVGDAKAVIIDRKKVFIHSANERSGVGDSLDAVRFVITKEMGTGTDILLMVRAKSRSIYGAPLTINALYQGGKKTDPDLVAELMATWLPENVEDYKPQNIGFTNNSSVTDEGEIWFDNPFGVFKVGAQVTPVIKKGQVITDQNNSVFSVDYIISSVISTDGKTLTFSSLVNEAVPGADSLYISRLCQLDIAANSFKTLNRTETYKGIGTYEEAPGPFSGPAANLKIAAVCLQTDVKGNIWFTNAYMPRYPDLFGSYNTIETFYAKIVKGDFLEQGGVFVVSKLTPDGNVQGVMCYRNRSIDLFTPYTISLPVLKSTAGPNFTLSRDGQWIYGSLEPAGGFDFDLNQYSVAEKDFTARIRNNQPNFTFVSYDDNPATKLPSNNSFSFMSTDYPYWRKFLVMPNGDMLIGRQTSIYSYDFKNMTAYCFAGIENENRDIPIQATGKASLVNFDVIQKLCLIGVDRNGSVYYSIGGVTGGAYKADFDNGVKFYKLVSKKK
ncbi:hypothetical protein HHL16_23520 [Pseudoflavitalea sp. G-6-1-2]|uniref:hypothetical protein n=1 Tax=Pseudoflavitalea sp. G-6-1-2 TaxID=2728841 RepID=UPI00146E500E|nr:hypothetical protein [Pseudoflavitalea sp. G-6-1-2]NML23870.1 hypothetical protein [Pseudoflavitalea sp. G-6-1-2]